jgi:hypothetical protein
MGKGQIFYFYMTAFFRGIFSDAGQTARAETVYIFQHRKK